MKNAKFIYVFSVYDKNMLMSLGYTLIQSNEKLDIYVFENSDKLDFGSIDMEYVLTNTLTF